MSSDTTANRPEQPQDYPGDPHDAGIRLGNDEALEEGGVGPMSHTYGAGGLGLGEGLGGTRDNVSNEMGGSTGAVLGGKGVAGTNIGSTDIGPADMTGGGDASGFGATDGGDTA
ncbi:MAG TPA: hypothetical protein VFO77_08875 [Actinoplanes sp.]|nr:hypothetical protein [Actinoplanes sp.]